MFYNIMWYNLDNFTLTADIPRKKYINASRNGNKPCYYHSQMTIDEQLIESSTTGNYCLILRCNKKQIDSILEKAKQLKYYTKLTIYEEYKNFKYIDVVEYVKNPNIPTISYYHPQSHIYDTNKLVPTNKRLIGMHEDINGYVDNYYELYKKVSYRKKIDIGSNRYNSYKIWMYYHTEYLYEGCFYSPATYAYNKEIQEGLDNV